jgi:hypothetical protein
MSTIKVNTLDSTTGTSITVPTGKTFVVTDTGALTIGGTAITTGSSNILRKTTDYTIVSGDVTSKSEVVIATNAAAATRTITLPAVATSGLSTCIITIVADADATSTYKLMVQDSASAEVWTGYQKNDFVRLVVSNSVWVVLDHKETYYSRFYLSGAQSLSAGADALLTGWTENSDIGNMWNNGNNEIVTPTSMTGFIDVSFMTSKNTTYSGTNPAMKLDGVWLANWDNGGTGTDQNTQNTGMCGGIYPVTSAQELEFWGCNNDSDDAKAIDGGTVGSTHFTVKFTRTY